MTSGPALKPRLAVFDFDGTLCSRNSYHVLLQDRLRSGLRPCLSITTALALRKLRLMTSEQLKNVVLAGFHGWSAERLGALGQRLYDNDLRPWLRPMAIQELRTRRADGFVAVVVSGAFEFLLRPFCVEYGLEICGCTQVAFSGERCLGHLAGPEMRAEHKCKALRDRFDKEQVDWGGSCAFADEPADLPVFQMVGQPFMVNCPASIQAEHSRIQAVFW